MNRPPNRPPPFVAAQLPPPGAAAFEIGQAGPDRFIIKATSGPLQLAIILTTQEAEQVAAAMQASVRKAKDERIVLADALGRETSKLA